MSPAAPGTPTPIRLPQAPPETFKQFLLYVYTGKVGSVVSSAEKLKFNVLPHCSNVGTNRDPGFVSDSVISLYLNITKFSIQIFSKRIFKQKIAY